jgi:hypothetical protein
MWASIMIGSIRWNFLLVILALQAGCGVSDTPATDAQMLDVFSTTSIEPAGSSNSVLARSGSSSTELIQNGTFASGTQFWTESANARAKYPTVGPIISAFPSGIALPVTENTQVARMCNFPGQLVITSGGGTTSETTNCLDRLTQSLSIPAGVQTLTLRVSAYADYAGCSNAKIVFGIKAGTQTLRPSLTLSSTNLSSGAWTDYVLDIDASNVVGGSNATLSLFGTVGGSTVLEKFCSTQQNVNLLVSNISLTIKN